MEKHIIMPEKATPLIVARMIRIMEVNDGIYDDPRVMEYLYTEIRRLLHASEQID